MKYMSDEDCLNWLKQNIEIEETPYIIGVGMIQDKDDPKFKFGYNRSKLVKQGEPLLLMARKITINDGSFTFSRYISTGSLPKSETLAGVKNDYVRMVLRPSLLNLENKTAALLATQPYVVYESPEQFVKFGNQEGRYVRRKPDEMEFFDSLRDLAKGGVNIKEIALITGEQDKAGKYKFLEYARIYNPNIDNVAYVNGKFALSGRYMVRVSYTNDNSNPTYTDTIFIVDLKKISTEDAINAIKSVSGDHRIAQKQEILHANSYSKLVLDVLGKINAYTINPSADVKLKTILTDFLTELSKNPDIHQERIKLVQDFINSKTLSDQK